MLNNITNNLYNTNNYISQALNELSSGVQITGAWVNPAEYEIAQVLNSESLGLSQAAQNINMGNSVLNIASGAVSNIQNILGVMNTLAINAANGTNSQSNLKSINNEFIQLNSEITQISNSTQFNGMKIFGGSSFNLQIGPNLGDSMNISVSSLNNIESLLSGVNLINEPVLGISAVQAAITQTSAISGELGSYQNRLINITDNINTTNRNIQYSYNNIMDVNYAEEMSKLIALRIIEHSDEALLGQSNINPDNILPLIT
jgi:flagellin